MALKMHAKLTIIRLSSMIIHWKQFFFKKKVYLRIAAMNDSQQSGKNKIAIALKALASHITHISYHHSLTFCNLFLSFSL